MAIVLSVIAVLVVLVAAAEATCYSPKERNGQCRRDPFKVPTLLFGTKTTYRHSTGLDSKRALPVNQPGCRQVLLMLFVRHTTRYPGKKDHNMFRDRLPELQGMILNASSAESGALCKEHVTSLRRWEYNWLESTQNRITPSGVKETRQLAKRFRKMFPDLLPARFCQDKYSVMSTSKVRTKETADAFLKGVLYRKEFRKFKEERALVMDDELLGFQSKCENRLEKEGVNKTESLEEAKFLNSAEVHEMVSAMSRRLGVNVSLEDVRLLAKACAFEVAHHGSSPFCYLFDKEDLDLLEYAEDLDDYEKDAYGNQRNVALGCVIVEELVGKIREKLRGSLTGSASNQTRLTAALYFTHSVLLKILVATLGKGKAVPALRASNYCHYKDQRPWRSSYLVPFTANFALVLYECANSQLRLMSILNERAVLLPGCKELFCPLEDFLRSTVVRSSRNCDPEKICSKSWNASSYPA